MLTSSIINSVPFLDLDGGNPNRWNTLPQNRYQAGYGRWNYCWKFNKDDVLYLQFTSDSATEPDLKVYLPNYYATITPTSSSSYSGDTDRYFYNFQITLGAAYYDKRIWFTVEQGSDMLTSVNVLCQDLSNEITKGKLKKIKYTNLDRTESDLSDYWIDWSESGISYMYFYVEAVDLRSFSISESSILEGAQYRTKVASRFFPGIILETGGIPDLMCDQISAVADLDYMEINDIPYICDEVSDPEPRGQSTLFQISLSLTIKNARGYNVDDLGITLTDADVMAIIPKRNTGVTTTGWQVENPEGYMLHSIWIKHAVSSVADATVKVGTSVGGSEIVDQVQGTVLRSEYSSTWKTLSRHYLKDPDAASTIYVTVTGAGTVLDIIINFDTVESL